MSNKKKIAIIGTVGLPANYGGFETLTEHLVKQLNTNYDITVYCSKKKYPKEVRKETYLGARLKYIGLNANGIQSIPYDTISIIRALFYADVLLILGVAGAWILPFVKLFTNKKIIISIDGIEWKRNKWSKPAKLYLWWAEKLAVKYSHADISDNESIQDYTAVRYKSLSHIIEYGANHTIKVLPTLEDKINYTFLTKPYAFKVCRIEPENNLDIVLEAFASLQKYPLVVVGNWNNSEYGKNLRKKYGHLSNLILLDPIYNQRNLDVLRGNAYLYIHGHSAGGTNPSLVEAMFLGLPILAFDVSYNKTTTENKAIYFKSKSDIIEMVQTTKILELKSKGETMKEIADRRYNWNIIAEKYQFLIEKVISNDKKVPVKPIIARIDGAQLLEYGIAHLQSPNYFFEKR